MTHVISRIRILLCMALVLACTANALAVEALPFDQDEIRYMIRSGMPLQAMKILRSQAEADPQDTNTRFLFALAAIEASRQIGVKADEQYALLDEAIAVLHAMLVNRPELVRVRLELARAFFYKREDRLAAKHFRQVLAGDPPEPVIMNVRQFLSAIRARRTWSVYLGGTLKPSNNIGRTSDTEIINIFGLPFRRDQVDKEESGIGLSIWGGGQYHYPLGPRTRLRMGADLAREEYSGERFDQFYMAVHAGPRWLIDANTSVSLLADVRRRWMQTSPYYLDAGIRSEIQRRLTRRLWLSARASWYDREYRTLDYLDGSTLDASVNGTWTLTPTIQLESALGYADEHTESETWRHDTRWARMGANIALPLGFTLGGSAEHRRTRYEGNWFPFTEGEPRKDRTNIFRASVYNRAFTVYGFSPQLMLTHEARNTNAQVYGYDSTSGEIRLVRQF